MPAHKNDAPPAPVAPLTTIRDLAVDTANREIGEATNKRVSTKARLETAVTENGTTKTTTVDAGVTLGVKTAETKAAPECCCDGDAACCCNKDAAATEPAAAPAKS